MRPTAGRMTGASVAAVLGAFCFAVGAALQQREALAATGLGVADPRLLWRLAHRPVWLAGIVADGLSAALHILALSMGSIAVVQTLGVTGLLFAIPLVALLRRQRIRSLDIAAAVAVLTGLAVLLQLFPAATDSQVAGQSVIVAVTGTTVAFAAGAATLAHFGPGRLRALLLAVGAGTSFGMTAVLVRALLQASGPAQTVGATVSAAVGIGILIPSGYLLLQNAYRAGHFAASLATAVVTDPLAAIIGSVPVLKEQLPTAPGQAVAALLSGALLVSGIVVLVRSPAHVFSVTEPDRGLGENSVE